MDTEKVTEVEMNALNTAEVQENRDAEKSKMEERKEVAKGAENKEKSEKEVKEETVVKPKLKNPTEGAEKMAKEIKEEETNVYCKLNKPTDDIYNTSVPTATLVLSEEADKKKGEEEEEEDEESSVYCKLKDPSENVYMSAMSSSTKKHNKDLNRKVALYKGVSAILTILSVLLLAAVLALALKLSELKSHQKCSTQVADGFNQAPVRCSTSLQCGKYWVKFENSCYYISQHRLNWQQGRNVCQQKGGDLVVIDSKKLQNFLTQHGAMQYWIGLRYSDKQQWMWTDNTTLTESYWADGQPEAVDEGSCAMINRARNKKQSTTPDKYLKIGKQAFVN